MHRGRGRGGDARRGGGRGNGGSNRDPGGGNHNGRGRGRERGPPGPNNQTDILASLLTLVFEKQESQIYNNGQLNISSFNKCPDLSSIASSINFDTAAFCSALCKVIKEKISHELRIINVDENGITNINFLLDALIRHDLHHGITAFSACNNRLIDFNSLDKLKRFENLNEVRFFGNPIASKTETYRKVILKKLPKIHAVDGEAVAREPLALPWPAPPSYNETQTMFLQMVEDLLSKLASHGADAVSDRFDMNCVATVTSLRDFSITVSDKVFRKNLSFLNEKIKNHSHNLKDHPHGDKRVARGRSAACVLLNECLYDVKRFTITHYLDGNADVQLFPANSTGLNSPAMAVVTVHGAIEWAGAGQTHKQNFDRTLSFCSADNASWVIINDMISIRPYVEPAVFTPAHKKRLERIAKQRGLEEAVVAAVYATQDCSSDAQLQSVLSILQAVSMPVVNQAVTLAGDTAQGIAICRVMALTGISDMNTAFEKLKAAGGNVGAAVSGS